jgi:hypothetical protein
MFAEDRETHVSIEEEQFHINGAPTYEDKDLKGQSIEGLLFNSRMVQALFDDENPETVDCWAYPDTGEWDPDRNVEEFLEAVPEYYEHGLRAVTVNLQGGSPEGYSFTQPWVVSAYHEDGSLKDAWLDRLQRVLERTDEVGMVVILGLFYQGQDGVLEDKDAVITAVENVVDWLLEEEFTNVLIEINNECNASYDHGILRPGRVDELIELVQDKERDGFRYNVSTSFTGGVVPSDNVIAAGDFVLPHGNGIETYSQVTELIENIRDQPSYEPMPIVFNEDDHYDFYDFHNHLTTAVRNYASWGFFDPGRSDYEHGYQCPPVNWRPNTQRKQAFFETVEYIVHGGVQLPDRPLVEDHW